MSGINAGNKVTADDINALVAVSAVKVDDQHFTSTTYANDDGLFVAVAANTTYIINAAINYEGGATGGTDLKIQFLIPSAATLNLGVGAWFGTDGNMHVGGVITGSFTFTAGTNGTGYRRILPLTGTLVVGSTSGTLQLQAAKNSSGSGDTIIHAYSYLAAQATS